MTQNYKNHIISVDIHKVSYIPCVGLGYDVHAFTEGDYITLCGIQIAHTHAFLAHSDGDVAMHAITDALYGAISDGDIGQHFPPSDDTFRNMDSRIFLEHACSRIREQGGYIGNIDITIVAQTPKISPHCIAMRKNIASILDIPMDYVSVKATTSEKMGFVGREEGVAVHAIANVFTTI